MKFFILVIIFFLFQIIYSQNSTLEFEGKMCFDNPKSVSDCNGYSSSQFQCCYLIYENFSSCYLLTRNDNNDTRTMNGLTLQCDSNKIDLSIKLVALIMLIIFY